MSKIFQLLIYLVYNINIIKQIKEIKMIMRTNVQMIRELNEKYNPIQRGIVHMSEIYMINHELELDKRDILDLRNLRDTVVLFLNALINEDNFKEMMIMSDKISAITCVIDQKIFNLGGEV